MFIAYYFLTLCSVFLIGYLCYNTFFYHTSDSPTETITWSFALGIPVISLIHFFNFWMGLNLTRYNIAIYFCVSLGLFIINRFLKKPHPKIFNTTFTLFLMYALLMLMYLTILPNYFLADTYDWRIYHPVSLVYLNFPRIIEKAPNLYMEYLVKRTPFYCLFNAFFMSLTGPFYYIFQITSVVANSLLFWVIYLLSTKLFNKKTALLSLMMLPLIPMFAGRLNFPIAKPLVMFFILLTIYQYSKCRIAHYSLCQRRDQVLTVISGLCAYMVHPMALFYLIWIALDQVILWIRRKTPVSFTFLFSLLIFLGVLIIPWYIWSISTYGWEQIVTPPAGIRESTHDILSYLLSRLTTIITSIFFALPHMLTFFNIEGAPMDLMTQRWFSWGNYLLLNYFETWLFGFSITCLPFAGIVLIKNKSSRSIRSVSPIFWLTLIGSLTVLAANLKIEATQAFNMLGPLSVLVYISICFILSKASKRTFYAFLIFLFIENICMRFVMFKMAKIYTTVAELVQHKDLPFLYDIVHSSFPNQLIISSAAIIILIAVYVVVALKHEEMTLE